MPILCVMSQQLHLHLDTSCWSSLSSSSCSSWSWSSEEHDNYMCTTTLLLFEHWSMRMSCCLIWFSIALYERSWCSLTSCTTSRVKDLMKWALASLLMTGPTFLVASLANLINLAKCMSKFTVPLYHVWWGHSRLWPIGFEELIASQLISWHFPHWTMAAHLA